MSKQSVFDDWNELVECNDCTHYWNDTCDGVKKGSQKPCTSFLATRSVVIPAQVKALQNALKWLTVGIIVETIYVVLMTFIMLGLVS